MDFEAVVIKLLLAIFRRVMGRARMTEDEKLLVNQAEQFTKRGR
ncbi:MAG: hypothetical protein WC593_14970 [Methanoregula sp.]